MEKQMEKQMEIKSHIEKKELKCLTPLQDQIINKTIENVNRKLIAGYRNRNLNPPKGTSPGAKATATNTINKASAESAMDVANRGKMWKEMISKSFSHGISSLSNLKFDTQFTIKDGVAEGLNDIPKGPGVYVVYNANGEVRYIGDAGNVQKRWQAGHLNENRQKERSGDEYKLNKELTEGCTVKVIECESVETAAALEASLIQEARSSDEYDVVNAKEELENKQGSRSNIEAKKIKDSMNSKMNLAKGAAKEAAINGGWQLLEQAITESIQVLKDEIVDMFKTGEHEFVERLKRLLSKIIGILRKQLGNIAGFVKGIFEFVVNAFSSAISQIYQLAKNIFELGSAAWGLYKNRKSMTKEDLIKNITETIIISGNVVFWNSMDLMMEAQLSAIMGPFAPFLAAIISALGFGLTSHYLSEFVPKIVDFIVGGFSETKENLQASSLSLVEQSQMNFTLVAGLEKYVQSTMLLISDIKVHEKKLNVVNTRTVNIREEIKF